jgi:hypothetical protein
LRTLRRTETGTADSGIVLEDEMIKTTGAEFKRFYNDPEVWQGDSFHEGELVTVNGVEIDEGELDPDRLADGDIVTVEGGVIYADARGEVERGSMESCLRKWRKAQSCVFFAVEAPKDKADEIKAAIKSAGGKVAR